MNYESIAVLIPAYKPDRRLNKLVDELIAKGFHRIVVIDDGGGAAYADIFRDLSGKATVLTHEVNRGKGAGLKTGIREIMKTPNVGVVTADADGQHTPDDVAKIADALIAHPDALILGSRDKKAMPLRSKAGNTLTCGVFGLLTGLWISDTQTGLRGLPACALEAFSNLEGDRYEYEINMLIKANELKMPVEEVSIETIYIDNNSSSHFNGLKDGLNVLEEIGIPCRRIVAAGGGARSDVWLQIQADIFERDVCRSASKEQACLGAAITAAVGVGSFADYSAACAACVEPPRQVFRPKEENVRVYRQMYPIFRELYASNRHNFQAISGIFQVE